VTGIEATGDASATVLLEPSAGEVCTADIAPTTHELTLPDEVTGRPVTITVTYSDWDETTELTLG
jgi:hypothetical protein